MPAKNINLLPEKEFDKSRIGKFLRWSLTYGRYIIVCTEIVVLSAFIFRFSLDRQITDLNEEIDQKAAIVEANLAFEQQFRNLQLRAEKIGRLVSDQSLAVQILQHLEQITPQGIIFKQYSYNGLIINITASANTDASLAVFLYNLKNSPLLTQINVASLTKKTTGVGDTDFQIQASLKSPAQNIGNTKNLSTKLKFDL